MFLTTALLIGLLVLGLFVAARELIGFQPEPEWKDAAKLREKLMGALPPAPHHSESGRMEIIRFCLQLRREFRSAWRLCRFLAPISGDPGYVGTLISLQVRFNGLLILSVFSATVGATQVCSDMTEQLRAIGATMRASALSILLNAELEGSAA